MKQSSHAGHGGAATNYDFGRLQFSIEEMTNQQRRLIWDRYANLTVGEIAAELGVSSSAVSQQMRVMRGKLRKDLSSTAGYERVNA